MLMSKTVQDCGSFFSADFVYRQRTMAFTLLFSLLLFCLSRVGFSLCDLSAFNNRKTFDALRKAESNGDLCKIEGGKLGPYQISKQYYKNSSCLGECSVTT